MMPGYPNMGPPVTYAAVEVGRPAAPRARPHALRQRAPRRCVTRICAVAGQRGDQGNEVSETTASERRRRCVLALRSACRSQRNVGLQVGPEQRLLSAAADDGVPRTRSHAPSEGAPGQTDLGRAKAGRGGFWHRRKCAHLSLPCAARGAVPSSSVFLTDSRL